MEKEDYALIDTKVWKTVQVPGLQSPKHQLSYDSTEVQRVLKESFNMMFPEIVTGRNGEKRYQVLNKAGEDIIPEVEPAKNINDIPRAEMMRLMEGWIRLRRKVQEGGVPARASSILLNFRVPNPRESLDRYMIHTDRSGEQKLVIRWGYENEDHRAVSLERAISVLMDVPLGHMRSILSTTMSPGTATVLVGQTPELEKGDRAKQDETSSSTSKSAIIGSIAACTVLGIAALCWLLFGASSEDEVASLDTTGTALGQAMLNEAPAATQVQEVVEKPALVKDEVLVEAQLEKAQPKVEQPKIIEVVKVVEVESAPVAPAKLSLDAMVKAKPSEENDLMGEMLGKPGKAVGGKSSMVDVMLTSSTSTSEEQVLQSEVKLKSLMDAMTEKTAPEKVSTDKASLEAMIHNEGKQESLLDAMKH
ncbi:hypothetical protein [Rubritalea marina]|uniref:hypothetical protein n=1 Tax=Rubritalea marina TaxID=361055 RepID=UPI00036CF0DB|nr:hypothetical protein [Rubritalea marina]